jgi:hypothetical protein
VSPSLITAVLSCRKASAMEALASFETTGIEAASP